MGKNRGVSGYVDLPFFEEFSRASEDDELFERIASGEALSDLPSEDIFMVSHAMDRDVPRMAHDYFELTYVYEGVVADFIDGVNLRLPHDSMCITVPGVVHGLTGIDSRAIVVVLALRPSLFEEGVFADFLAADNPVSAVMRGGSPHGYLVLSDSYGRILYRSMRALLKEYAHAGQIANFSVRARVLLLLSQLSEVDTYSLQGLDPKMFDIVSYLEQHCATASVASLAQRFGYAETYFTRLVYNRCGMHARELIVAARLRQSRRLLLETDLPVTKVAAAVGYESYSHFNRIFRKAYHITPAAYRAFAQRDVRQRPS